MPNRPDEETIGVYLGAHEDIHERFDDYFSDRESGSYSRSRKIKDAMELFLAVQQVLDDAGFEIEAEQSKRHWVETALRKRAAEELDE